jgi:hypothetical protein
MHGRLTVLLIASLCSTGAVAQARSETWSCTTFFGSEALVVAAHEGGNTGTIAVAGTQHKTRYGVEGFDRRWSFGPVVRDTTPRFLFLVEPDGDGYYFDFAEGPDSQQRYWCDEAAEIAARASRSDNVQRERAALDVPPQTLVAEAVPDAARAAELRDQYTRMIENHVKRYWQRPLSARPGIECQATITQLPTGDVVSAKVEQCDGDDAVRRSIENAIMKASPLPRPPSQAVFSRNLALNFRPDE